MYIDDTPLFKDEHLNTLFERVRPFEESAFSSGTEYVELYQREYAVYNRIVAIYGASIIPLLEELGDAICQEEILERMHYFREGYLAGKREMSKKKPNDE